MSDRAPGLILLSWKPPPKNTLRGFASIRLRNGLVINDVSVHRANGKAWAALPSKPMIGSDGTPIRDRETGKVRYAPILAWSDRTTSDRFSEAVVAAVGAMDPEALA